MKTQACGLLLLTLMSGSAFQPKSALRIEAGYWLRGLVGGTTMAALSEYQVLQKTASRDTLTASQVDTLQKILSRASSSRHWQQKLGGRYAALEVTVGQQPVPLLIAESGRLVVLLDKLGRSAVAPGHNYHINNRADQTWLRRFASAPVKGE
ncbi:hypothetical protein [Hymenobacter cellulosilyticus]|uniref:Uncharacterized protein n=1 Tax=Hymenobacter cellulosilyticus TaxID=2932248 RepID=A0A8T9QEZ5_9BACT|nr:hypothetical protein [Hymenobacter cellulosilyticus]UOQ74738.1 hypothetical protein MUN79_13185 [Hymenobacter cellulosilyticus]